MTHNTSNKPNYITQENGDVISPNKEVTDMYLVHELGKPIITRTNNPFLATPCLQGPEGEQVCFLAVVDNGAMINAMDTAAYMRIAQRLSPLSPSSRKLQMANGLVVLSTGVWVGNLEWGPLTIQTTFKVFPSRGSWRMLIGKPLLEQVKATHDYCTDSITIPTNTSHHCIHNFIPHHILPTPSLPTMVSLPVRMHFPTGPTPTSPDTGDLEEHANVQHITTTTPSTPPVLEHTLSDVPPLPPHNGIFTRLTDEGPFHPPRVDAIINMVQIGDDSSPDETTGVCDLLREFADIFALSVKEVKPLSSIKYCLNIPEGSTFSVKANQRPLNQAQKDFYFSKLTEFVDAGVLKPIHISQVKALHPTVLAQKAHETPGLTIDEICQEVNKQCILLGEQSDPNVLQHTGPPTTQVTHPQTNSKKLKWHITQNFSQLSRVCKSAQMP